MGAVYRADDTALGREVAIKVLPEGFTADAERLARFEREAKVLAALSHPNIAVIYEVGADEGTHFIAMELAAGEDLAERLARGPIALDEALPIALQMANALEAAHERGIVHRDLKPANVKVVANDPSGVAVKVLDFGLAKVSDQTSTGAESLSMSPTLTAQMTHAGVILGTAPYMSPEQARGQEADKRSDIWSFGAVLLEMLSGKMTFRAETVSDTLAAVLTREPDWSALPSSTPRVVVRLIERCLEKNVTSRLRDIGEARVMIERYLDDPGALEPAGEPSAGLARRASLVGLAAGLIVGAVGGWWLTNRSLANRSGIDPPAGQSVPVRKFTMEAPSLEEIWGADPKLSPSGDRLLYVTSEGMHIRRFRDLEPTLLEDTVGASATAWSPDGQWVAWAEGMKLWKMPAAGGKPFLVCELPERATAARIFSTDWSPQGRLAFSSWHGPMLGVPASGGEPELVLPLAEDEVDFHHATFLPDGKTILFQTHRRDGGTSSIEALRDGKRTTILEIEGQNLNKASYASSGHLIWGRTGTNDGVWAASFSVERLEMTGEPFLVAAAAALPSTAEDGSLVFVGARSAERRLVWSDLGGEALDPIDQPLENMFNPALSPDGRRIVVGAGPAGERDLWVFEIERSVWTKLSLDQKLPLDPAWSQDNLLLAYGSQEGIFVVAADGSEEPRQLAADGAYPRFTRDGKYLLYEDHGESAGIWRVPLDDAGPSERILAGTVAPVTALPHPSGKYLAYTALEENGDGTIYLTRYPELVGRWQVFAGVSPFASAWSRDGERLVFTTYQPAAVWEVEVATDPEVRLGTPRQLFPTTKVGTEPWWGQDLGIDGERLLLVQVVQGAGGHGRITLVQNWLSAFE